MSIYEDAQKGLLVGATLDAYIAKNPNILDEQSADSGLTVLSIAAIEGFPEEVEQLLKKGARADALTKDDETPLLLAAWKGKKERARIIQLLLKKTPLSSINRACERANFNTPLMFAIEKKDYESIRLLVQAGAAEDKNIKNSDGFTVKQIADAAKDRLVTRSLLPDEKLKAAVLAADVTSFLLYIVAWANKAVNGLVTEVFRLNPELNESIDEQMTQNQDLTKEEFVERVNEWMETHGPLKRFFQGNDEFVQDMAEKLVNLEQDPANKLRSQNLAETIKLSLYKLVIYCDDSTSMKRDGRWESQKELVQRIAKIATMVLPPDEGVALRFINRNVENSDNLTLERLGNVLKDMDWRPGGDTPIGTNLRSKILQPLVYSKLDAGNLDRPLIVIIMTDGMPEREDKTELEKVILECEKKIRDSGYPPQTVKFMIGQIGTAKSAARFLASLRQNSDIARTTLVTSDKLDDAFKDYKENDSKLDKWLVETLFSPFRNLTGNN
ncbi:hypothetical protein N5P37_010035 [Trichoderma harzianum]|uniref:VWFA domain-containing protein n=1 Tax=Trichoderma harzianum CBS 226.95 TaxID=983964 RepID=A0A2T4A5C2_TRIHA|nr:hypothetical protein M431DRAFT_120914 [Trichoderma harzianum CBS 226.95]KAK0757315.1 hypothetical protein N5P37_010035 [Trichoderma harzianum]PTB52267.1 hypothetical protein M431DRAFT_120914 [Trichoderma harzianum CBS 226.95]